MSATYLSLMTRAAWAASDALFMAGTDLADLALRVNTELATWTGRLASLDIVGSGDGQVVCVLAKEGSNGSAAPWDPTPAVCTLYLSDSMTLQELMDTYGVGQYKTVKFAKVAGAPQGSRKIAAILVQDDTP